MQLGTYPTPGRAWIYKSLFLGSKQPRGPGKLLQKVVGDFWKGFPGPRGSLDPKNKDLENHARNGLGCVPSCLHYAELMGPPTAFSTQPQVSGTVHAKRITTMGTFWGRLGAKQSVHLL